jgi:hypothetical protein
MTRYFYSASHEEFSPEITLHNNSGADPERAIEVLGREVLPALRGSRV